MRVKGVFALAVACCLAAVAVVVPPPLRPAAAAGRALPADRLHFGVANGPDRLGWMSASGVPWRYRYTYLAGGVNTSAPWPTWQDPALPPGQYALDYMRNSAAHGYMPVFPYYQLLQSLSSSDTTGQGESARDLAHLNDAALMRAYYQDFQLLMQKAGQYGGEVVVDVEPDLWGYLEQQAAGGPASNLAAAVGSTGYGLAAALPNSAQGFAWTLLRIRDTYAPNALLAIHASLWSSGIDLGSSTDPAIDARVEAGKTASFLGSAGLAGNPYGSTWDLVFNDVDDHDAGWWEAQGADNQWFSHWWDPTNTRFPNFSRYVAWVAELHARTARPEVAWQVPIGNQYYLTMNNTCGHYQDNIAAYFISHAADLYQAGLVAVLFGAGNGCQTTNEDSQNDGVTNNGGVPTSDALGACTACNTHSPVAADDDGGYLRTFVGQYYATPPPAPSTGPYSALPTPVRILDTRTATGGHPYRMSQGEDFSLPIVTHLPPGAAAGAAVLNATVTGASTGSLLTIFPQGTLRPLVSNINFSPGEQRANLVIVRLGSGGGVTVHNDSGSVDVVLDLVGYFQDSPGSHSGLFNPLSAPARVLDTRTAQGAHAFRLGPQSSLHLSLAGTNGIPNTGAGAVSFNLTAIDGTSASYLSVLPQDGPQGSDPAFSNVNFPPHVNVPNRVISTLSPAGAVTLFNSGGWVDVAVDVTGWFTDSSNPSATGYNFTSVSPARIFDSRTGHGALPPHSWVAVALPNPAAAAVLNVTGVAPSAATFLTVYASTPTEIPPPTSDLNLPPGPNIANLCLPGTGPDGKVAIWNDSGYSDVVVDLAGYFS